MAFFGGLVNSYFSCPLRLGLLRIAEDTIVFRFLFGCFWTATDYFFLLKLCAIANVTCVFSPRLTQEINISQMILLLKLEGFDNQRRTR
jgi:hypothetical protein